jgi:hypothetical protein
VKMVEEELKKIKASKVEEGRGEQGGAGIKFVKTTMMMVVHRWAPFAETAIVD